MSKPLVLTVRLNGRMIGRHRVHQPGDFLVRIPLTDLFRLGCTRWTSRRAPGSCTIARREAATFDRSRGGSATSSWTASPTGEAQVDGAHVTTAAAPSPRVAIAVPSLDQGRFLGQALDSVFAQTGVDVGVAVLDAGSRDDSRAVIRRYESRLTYWRSSPDAGQAAAINEGIAQLAGTRHVTWLNADDVLLPGALARMAAYLDAHPDCVAVFGEAHIIDAVGLAIGRFPTRPFSRGALARTSIICQPASLISRRAWEAVRRPRRVAPHLP